MAAIKLNYSWLGRDLLLVHYLTEFARIVVLVVLFIYIDTGRTRFVCSEEASTGTGTSTFHRKENKKTEELG